MESFRVFYRAAGWAVGESTMRRPEVKQQMKSIVSIFTWRAISCLV
jgi:hypothetical protein